MRNVKLRNIKKSSLCKTIASCKQFMHEVAHYVCTYQLVMFVYRLRVLQSSNTCAVKSFRKKIKV